MVAKKEYSEYFGVTTPLNFERLEYLSIRELQSIMEQNIPTETDLIYGEFKKAIMEQINYFVENPDLIDSAGSGNYTLGSYSESNSNLEKTNSKSITRISPVAYDILLDCGLLYIGKRSV